MRTPATKYRQESTRFYTPEDMFYLRDTAAIFRLRRNFYSSIYLDQNIYLDQSIKMSGNSVMIAPTVAMKQNC